jgi:hypothetical protein
MRNTNSYIEIIDVNVAGIPCKAGVSYFSSQSGSYSYNAASDMDYLGYTEIEWDLLDRKGYVAGRWLTSKMSKHDIYEIESQIAQAMCQDDDY